MGEEEATTIYACLMALKGLSVTMKDLSNLSQFCEVSSSSPIELYQLDSVFCQKVEAMIKEKVEKKTGVHRLK